MKQQTEGKIPQAMYEKLGYMILKNTIKQTKLKTTTRRGLDAKS